MVSLFSAPGSVPVSKRTLSAGFSLCTSMHIMHMADQKLRMDFVAWFLNVSTSVLIVFVNKILIDDNRGYGFVFTTSLCAFHFLTCAFSSWLAQIYWNSPGPKLPLWESIYFAIVSNVSVGSLNLSLLVNTVGFYQVAKLLVIPFVCSVEYFGLGRKFTTPIVVSISVVIMGVGIVTVTDVQVSTTGILIAGISVVSSGMQQILCGTIQRKHKLSSHQMLSKTAYIQGFMLILIGPFLDQAISHRWILDADYSAAVIGMLLFSCTIAVLVNVSQFACLGRFSAATFQVLGHTKTVLVLLIGWQGLGEVMTLRKATGMLIAVSGMVLYGYFSTLQQHNTEDATEDFAEGKALLGRTEATSAKAVRIQ